MFKKEESNLDTFKGFNESDFNVFNIDGLEERMTALKEEIRPKLDWLGHHFAPSLSAMVGEEMFYHVAKHARRSVNPPNDTWVAFASHNRGYKMLPHFQIGLWETHLFIWFAIIYECPTKQEFGVKLEEHLQQMTSQLPPTFVWSGDHTSPHGFKQEELSDIDLLKMVQRLKTVKKAEILCGLHINRNDPVLKNSAKLLDTIEQTFKQLVPLYNLSKTN